MNPPVFDNRPRAMFLAVLAANLGAQKHEATCASPMAAQETWSAPQAVSQASTFKTKGYRIRHRKNRKNRAQLVKLNVAGKGKLVITARGSDNAVSERSFDLEQQGS